LIKEALILPEIIEGLAKASLSASFLYKQIYESYSKNITYASNDVEDFEFLISQLDNAEEELRKSRLSIPRWLKLIKAFRNIMFLISVATMLILILTGFYRGWSVSVSILTLTEFIVAALVCFGLIIASCIAVNRSNAWFEFKNAYHLYLRQSELGIEKLEQQLIHVKERTERAIVNNIILPEARSIINSQISASYDTVLLIHSAPGLADVFDPEYEIPTKAKNQIQQLLQAMPGGSIGIAGPRGAGKTTLLRSFYEGFAEKLKSRDVLAVVTFTPVDYVAREYILYLFSSICRRLLKAKKESVTSYWGAINSYQDWVPNGAMWSYLDKTTRSIGYLLSIVGMLLLTLGLSAALEVSSTNQPNQTFEALGFRPGELVVWGGVLSIGGFVLFSLSARSVRMQEYNKRNLERERYNDYVSSNVVSEARRLLRKIQFQQSFSSGWGGSLRVPIGPLELSSNINNAMALAEHHWSLPDIISEYRNFIELLIDEYVVIVGIDELDKIATDEKAQQFLNDIKAIFGIEDCFYLVSISESAMSNFERRGLPFRDVFDSSFDTTVYVDYLKFEEARMLIKRRVIGISDPFIALCYCLSGGLARDLIRAVRELFELFKLFPKENSLKSLSSRLIHSDLKLKIRAMSIAMRELGTGIEITIFYRQLQQLEQHIDAQELFLSNYRSVILENNVETDDNNGKHWKLLAFKTELEVYVYYSTTLLEFFAGTADAVFFQRQEKLTELDKLAKARQFLAVDPNIARMLLDEFRKNNTMKT
jgi:Cdc6-like AAA superfamily ATPase